MSTETRTICERWAHDLQRDLEPQGIAFALIVIRGRHLEVGTNLDTEDLRAALLDYLARPEQPS